MNREAFITDYQRLRHIHGARKVAEKLADYIELRFVERPGPQGPAKVHHDKVIGLCCQHFEISLEDMIKPDRTEAVKYKRQVTAYLLHHRTRMNNVDIGILFNRHRTTILQNVERIQNLMDTDPYIREEVEMLNERL